MTLLNPAALFLLPLAPLLWFFAERNRRTSVQWRRLRDIPLPRIVFLRPWLEAFAVLCLVLALARPVRNPQAVDAETRGQDSIFLVDVSRSMETRDLNGESRLEAVKRSLLELVPHADGDRLALVAFAGSAVAKCPLTTDTAFFSQAVRLLDTGAASRGGTLLGDALRQVRTSFAPPQPAGNTPLESAIPATRHRAVWVFTDGGDQESFPVEAARELGEAGFSLHLWGVGTLEGDTVPERGVRSTLNEELLADIAAAIEGGSWYGTSTPLWRLAGEYSRQRRPGTLTASTRVVWQEDAWFLLWPAFAALFADTLLSLWPSIANFVLRRRKRGAAA